MTSKELISKWLNSGDTDIYSHMIVVCDTYDYDDYPVFILKSENINLKVKSINGSNMQRVMEVYNYSLDLKEQLNQCRAFNL